MKCAIYVRVSTEDQSREGCSLDNQLEKCRLQARISDYTIANEIIEAGKSAKNLDRPGIQEILSLVKKKAIDAVLIHKLCRLSRNVSDLNRLVELFTKQGIALISVKDNIDTQSASGRMIINLFGTLSQFERETIAERTKDAMAFKKSENQKFTSLTPFGFRLDSGVYVEAPEEQATIREIIRLRDDAGLSFQGIADYLNGIGTPTRKGKAWVKQSVTAIYSGTKQGTRMRLK